MLSNIPSYALSAIAFCILSKEKTGISAASLPLPTMYCPDGSTSNRAAI